MPSSTANAITTQQPCPLLSLPAELRNRIYSYILVEPIPIQISERSPDASAAARGATTHYDRVKEPAFLLTNHQIRFEALPIFYGDNVFFTAIKNAIAPWLRAIGPEKACLIRCIRGFRPSRYFKYEWAKSLSESVEREVRKEGCRLGAGVFRTPFGHEDFPGKVFWLSVASDVVLSTSEGRIEHAREAFEVVTDADGGVRLLPAKSLGV